VEVFELFLYSPSHCLKTPAIEFESQHSHLSWKSGDKTPFPDPLDVLLGSLRQAPPPDQRICSVAMSLSSYTMGSQESISFLTTQPGLMVPFRALLKQFSLTKQALLRPNFVQNSETYRLGFESQLFLLWVHNLVWISSEHPVSSFTVKWIVGCWTLCGT
jgi:hypothetical protein